jgi:hypothetical protein
MRKVEWFRQSRDSIEKPLGQISSYLATDFDTESKIIGYFEYSLSIIPSLES